MTKSNGWEWVKISEVLQPIEGNRKVQRGWSPQCESRAADTDEWGVLKTTAVQMGAYEPQYNKALPIKLVARPNLEVLAGDFLMTTTGPRNRCGVICFVEKTPHRLIFSGKILRFRSDPERIVDKWLLYVLLSPSYQEKLDQLKVGTSDSSVSIGNQQVLDLEIPVPPLEHQHEMVERIESALLKAEQAGNWILHSVRSSKEMMRSILRDAFANSLISSNATLTTLSDACELITDGSHFSPKQKPVGRPYITVRDLSPEGDIDLLYCNRVSDSDFDLLSKNGCRPSRGDILFSKDGTVGKVALVETAQEFVVLSSLAILRPDPSRLRGEFLALMLRSSQVQETALGMKSGTAIRRVVLRSLRTIEIPLPSLQEQDLIVATATEQILNLRNISVQLTKLEDSLIAWKRSFMHGLFANQEGRTP